MCCIEENRKKFNKLINNTWKSTYQIIKGSRKNNKPEKTDQY